MTGGGFIGEALGGARAGTAGKADGLVDVGRFGTREPMIGQVVDTLVLLSNRQCCQHVGNAAVHAAAAARTDAVIKRHPHQHMVEAETIALPRDFGDKTGSDGGVERIKRVTPDIACSAFDIVEPEFATDNRRPAEHRGMRSRQPSHAASDDLADPLRNAKLGKVAAIDPACILSFNGAGFGKVSQQFGYEKGIARRVAEQRMGKGRAAITQRVPGMRRQHRCNRGFIDTRQHAAVDMVLAPQIG